MTNWVWQPLSFSFLLEALQQSIRNAGIVDLFDIAAVTFLIYLALRWIRRARAIRVLEGLLIMGVLYAVASETGLVLTTSLFRGLFTVALVSLAGLFQEDLRHFFERLTVYRQNPMQRRTFQALLRSVRYFSRHHIGALIVLKGRDPLDRHLDGGQVLGGRISSALLESLFDPHSDGHDGAAIVDGDQVSRFGVHLPLSRGLDHESGLGTRHAAALGLAEVSDAFCLVVSESRGTVMIAREGRLLNMGGRQRLEKRVAEFLREKFQTPASARASGMLWDHPAEKVISLTLGLALWLVFVKGIKPAELTVSMPVQMTQVPAGLQLESISPSKAIVTFRGLERDLRALPQDLKVSLAVPDRSRKLQRITLSSNFIHVPKNLHVASLSPDSITLRFKTQKTTRPAPAAPARHTWFGWR